MFLNDWVTMFVIMTYPAKISPREGNHKIKWWCIYRNIGEGGDVYGGVRPAGLNEDVYKHGRRVKLGNYLIDYKQLEKTLPNSCFVVALLLRLWMYNKNSCISKKLMVGRKIDELISPEDVRHVYKEVNFTLGRVYDRNY